MPVRGGTTNVHNAIRLPPLRTLKVRKPDKGESNPCVGVMSSVLGCWASAGPAKAATQCMALEQQLRACMDTKTSTQQKKSNINSQLSRLYPQMVGPRKRDK